MLSEQDRLSCENCFQLFPKYIPPNKLQVNVPDTRARVFVLLLHVSVPLILIARTSFSLDAAKKQDTATQQRRQQIQQGKYLIKKCRKSRAQKIIAGKL